jgi:hypothetical protein
MMAAFMRKQELGVGRLVGQGKSAHHDYGLAARVADGHRLLGKIAENVSVDIAIRVRGLRHPHSRRLHATAEQAETCHGHNKDEWKTHHPTTKAKAASEAYPFPAGYVS